MDKNLNKEQIEAITHKTGPLLVIAGAGTGKTTVITERVKYLITEGLAKPHEILALTFTQKAAGEMEERIDTALPYGYTNMWIMTFHSFCERILRQEALHIGLDTDFKLLTEAEATQLIKDNIFKFKLKYFRPLGNPNKFVGGMLQHFSRLQDENITAREYMEWSSKRNDEKERELSSAFMSYEEIKTKNSFMDFGDLITKTIKLFRERPKILEHYQEQFKYILVDEFQDTNYAQNELLKLLSGKTKNITVVGDDDQSVYRFRGAAISNIINFRKSFPGSKIVVLTKNYRSTQEILDKSHDLISRNNPDRLEVVENIDKRLVSQRKIKGEKIRFIHANKVEDEAEEVANEIINLSNHSKGGYKWKDFAILVRANNHSEPFMRALARFNIPYQFLGPGKLFRQPEIVDLISYLRVLYNFEDSSSFYRVLSMDIFEINPREIARIGNLARKSHISLFEAAENSENESVAKIVKMIDKHLGLIKKESAGQILYYFLEDTGLFKNLLKSQTDDAEKKAKNISKFFDKIKSYETDHPDANLFSVVDWLNLSQELGESPLAPETDWEDHDAVNILTIHSAKGLEFSVVFLVNLVNLRFPTTQKREQIPIPEDLIKEILPTGDYHLEEERRLFYVGMTRAKDLLYFTAANYYKEGKKEKIISPFVREALGEELEKNFKTKIRKSNLTGYEKKEKREESAVNDLKINYLSYSQIETFKTCPLHYKLKYILNIPTPPSASMSFGNSIHNALKDFYESVLEGEKPSEKMLLAFLKKDWISEGFLDKNHEKEFQEKGKKFLITYFKRRFNQSNLPVLMECPFTVPLSNDLKIGGKIDRVDELSDGSIEIWDYKTGANLPTQKEINHNLQLTFYALAATNLKEKPFNQISPEKIKLTLYYFEEDKKITVTRTKSDLIKAKEEIIKIRSEIEKSDFKCNGSFLCKNCEYKNLCESLE